MNELKIRPWKELQKTLPSLSQYELGELKASIRDHGVLQKILVLPDGRIIDGYHRWKLSGENVPYRVLEVNEEIGFALGLTLNIGRRQITANQFKSIRSLIRERHDVLIETVLELRKQGKTQKEVGKILGVPRQTISRWENVSNAQVGKVNIPDLRTMVPKKERPKIYERAKKGESQEEIAADYKIDRSRVSQIVKQERRREEQKIPKLPEGEFNVILADPPWRYDFSLSHNNEIENKYPTMELNEIQNLSIPCAEDSILFLWTTMPKLCEGLKVMKSWGFKYKTGMVWVKDKVGMGYYARGKHELILIGTRGSMSPPDPSNRPESVIEAPRTKHSEKPTEIYEIIERMYPKGRYLELFARDFSLGIRGRIGVRGVMRLINLSSFMVGSPCHHWRRVEAGLSNSPAIAMGLPTQF